VNACFSRARLVFSLITLVTATATAVRAETIVTGVEGEVLENILIFLDLDDLDCDAPRATVESAANEAPEQVAEAVAAFGYYDPSVTTNLEFPDTCWQAEVVISPGDPVRLRTIDIDIAGPAAGTEEFRALRDGIAFAPGDRLNHGAFDSLKRNLLDRARNRGFAEARFEESRIDIYPAELAADISLRFESGPRYNVGQVTVNQEALDPEFVDSFHELESGEPFDNRLLTSAFLDLTDSGYFSSVDVRALPPDAESQTIPVLVELMPAPRRVISYGVGVSTDTGPRLRFGRSIRRFNSQGHQLSIDGQLSPVVSELTANYRMPLRDPRVDWLNFSLGAKREETETSLARSIEASVRRVVDRFIVEDFEVGTQTGRPKLLIPGVDWSRIRGDNALRPDNGSRISFELRVADEALISDTGFFQAIASVKWIRSLSERGRILLRGRAGYTAEDEFEKLPPSIRFFAGGDSSVRGFEFETLGPVDVDGHVIGGPRLIEASVEYEHEVKPRWSVAVFSDSGNAFDETDVDLRTGAGIGARWRSPLGPVRFDVAWPVNDIEDGPRLHISLGPDL
jgi:translocation and assembly module TamA